MATPEKKTAPPPAKKAEPQKAPPAKATTATTPAKTTTSAATPQPPAPAKPPEKATPPRAPEKDATKADTTSAPKPEPRQAEPESKTEGVKDQDTLSALAVDRGWLVQEPVGSDKWDVVYTKPNPVLGGYEHLRLKFKGDKIGEIEHENLNVQQEVPDKDKLDYATSTLTGE